LQNERAVAVNHAQALAVTPLANSDAGRDRTDKIETKRVVLRTISGTHIAPPLLKHSYQML
jgi:hypothetical protein